MVPKNDTKVTIYIPQAWKQTLDAQCINISKLFRTVIERQNKQDLLPVKLPELSD